MRAVSFAVAAAACLASVVAGATRLRLSPMTDPEPAVTAHGSLLVPALALLAVAAFFVGVYVMRRARGREPVERFWLLPYRTDEATSEALDRLVCAFHAALNPSAWQRLTRSAPTLGLEVWSQPERFIGARLVLACPSRHARGLAGAVETCYPQARLIPFDASPPPRAGVVAGKRDVFVRRLAAATEEQPGATEALLSALGAATGPAVVQLCVTPAPRWTEVLGRWLLRSRERQLEADPLRRESRPGPRSTAAGVELEGAEALVWQPLWFCQLRIAAESSGQARDLVGALQGATAENRWQGRRTSKRTLAERIAAVRPPVVPDLYHGVFASSELAAIYRLPLPSFRAVSFERSAVPRMPAPPEVRRPATELGAIGRDERGYVGLRRTDLEKNLALVGQIGSGKTSVLARTTERDAIDPTCCVIVIDPNSTGVDAHLSAVPEGRTVHVRDVARPECGFNPLLASGAISKVADDVVEAFVDVHDDGEIMTSSRQFLGGAAEAVIGAYRKGALGQSRACGTSIASCCPTRRRFASGCSTRSLRSANCSGRRRCWRRTSRTGCATSARSTRCGCRRRATSSFSCARATSTRCCATHGS